MTIKVIMTPQGDLMTDLGTPPEKEIKEILDGLDSENEVTLDILSVIRHAKYFHGQFFDQLQQILRKH